MQCKQLKLLLHNSKHVRSVTLVKLNPLSAHHVSTMQNTGKCPQHALCMPETLWHIRHNSTIKQASTAQLISLNNWLLFVAWFPVARA
jgi:hypothetical protein